MTNKDRYNQITKHIFALALIPQSPYKFKYTCKLMSRGVMCASVCPVDESLTSWPWFKAGVAILKDELFDETKAVSPDDLNVQDWSYNYMMDGFKTLVKSLRWYIQHLQALPKYGCDDNCPPVPVESDSDAACAILRNIILPIDGGYLDLGGYIDEDDDKIQPRPIENLLFYDNKSVGIREFRPWSLRRLYDECDKNLNLSLVPWGTLLDQRETFNSWFASFIDEPTAGDEDLDSYLTMLEAHFPNISEDHWFEGYSRDTGKSAKPPVEEQPADKPEPKSEKKGVRFVVSENTPDGCTTYRDEMLGTEYVISNRTNAKKIIDKYLVGDLIDSVKQWHPDWKNVKGSFQRDDGARFNADQIIHEQLPSFTGGMTLQFSGKWRIRTDEEMINWMKDHKPASKKSKR